jgi:hypothetical protein
MLATHVWKTHRVWADEYRALFGLRASRGGGGSGALAHALADVFATESFWELLSAGAWRLTPSFRALW